MEEKESKSVKAVTLKLTPEVYSKYKQLEAEIDAPTVNNFMETVIERVYSPIKINEENLKKLEENKSFIAELQQKIAQNEQNYTDLDNQISARDAEILRLQEENQQLRGENDSLKNNLNFADNVRPVTFEPLNLKLLEYVAKREGEKRKQNWTLDDVINFFAHYRFEKGSLNGDLDSVPDRIVEKLKKSLND